MIGTRFGQAAVARGYDYGLAARLPQNIGTPLLVVSNENKSGQSRFRLISGRPRRIGPKDLPKIIAPGPLRRDSMGASLCASAASGQ